MSGKTMLDRRGFLGAAALGIGVSAISLSGCQSTSSAPTNAMKTEDTSNQTIEEIIANTNGALPSDIANLPVIQAEFFTEVAPGSKTDALEGIMFDKAGKLYVCHRFSDTVDGKNVTSSEICAIDESGAVVQFIERKNAAFNGIAIHKDGSFFIADMTGHIWVYPATGGNEPIRELPLTGVEVVILPNDLTFDANTGDLYFVNFNGSFTSLSGGVYRLSANSDYQEINEVIGGLVTPNGISFNIDFTSLTVAETALNRIIRMSIAEGVVAPGFLGCSVVYQGQGVNGPDSNRVDADGNTYQAYYPDGRALIFNKSMIPIANIIPSDRDGGEGMKTSSLALHPSRAEGYLISGGPRGMWILKFQSCAASAPLWHLQ